MMIHVEHDSIFGINAFTVLLSISVDGEYLTPALFPFCVILKTMGMCRFPRAWGLATEMACTSKPLLLCGVIQAHLVSHLDWFSLCMLAVDDKYISWTLRLGPAKVPLGACVNSTPVLIAPKPEVSRSHLQCYLLP